MDAKEAIEAVRRGERVAGKHSIRAEEDKAKSPTCAHRWRTLFCDDVTDVVECYHCGKQGTAHCDFDDEFA